MQFFPEVYARHHGPEAQSTDPYWCAGCSLLLAALLCFLLR